VSALIALVRNGSGRLTNYLMKNRHGSYVRGVIAWLSGRTAYGLKDRMRIMQIALEWVLTIDECKQARNHFAPMRDGAKCFDYQTALNGSGGLLVSARISLPDGTHQRGGALLDYRPNRPVQTVPAMPLFFNWL